MLPILSPAETRKLEEITAEKQGITSFDLMRRAGKAFAKQVIRQFPHNKKITIVCGTGNNGGDGLCIAKNLLEAGKKVSVWVIDSEKKSENFLKAWRKLEHSKKIAAVKTISPKMLETELLIDAIFGYGLSRPLSGAYAESAAAMNEAKAVRLAADIPSGLFADKPSEGVIFKAHFTYTFELPKLAMLLPENYPYAGEWKVLNINLSRDETATSHYYIEKSDIQKILRTRAKFDHKGMFGHAYIIAGSKGKMGAAVLSARAALASGTGLLTVHIPSSGAAVIHASLPEAMVSADAHPDYFTKHLAQNFSACGVGPGLGMNEATVQALGLFLKEKKPCVLDADALNILAENPSMQKLISPGSILTPHLKEFERLAGVCSNPYERLEKLSALANKLTSVVVLKGAHTAIASPEGKIFFNPTGNPGMATAGAGDVLTGLLTSFLAQGYSALNAAILGVYFHGFAGDLAILNKGTIISSDLISCLPKALGRMNFAWKETGNVSE